MYSHPEHAPCITVQNSIFSLDAQQNHRRPWYVALHAYVGLRGPSHESYNNNTLTKTNRYSNWYALLESHTLIRYLSDSDISLCIAQVHGNLYHCTSPHRTHINCNLVVNVHHPPLFPTPPPFSPSLLSLPSLLPPLPSFLFPL